MDIAKFKPAIVYVIYIDSTPAKVWEVLTTAEFSRRKGCWQRRRSWG